MAVYPTATLLDASDDTSRTSLAHLCGMSITLTRG